MQKTHVSEYERAAEQLEKLVKAILPRRQDWRDRLLMVPGNHDVDIRPSSADQIRYAFGKKNPIRSNKKSADTSHRRFGLQAFRDFAWNLSANRHWRDADDLIWINDSFRHIGLRLYMLNSAALIDSRDPKNYQIPIDALEKMIDAHSSKEDLFGIVLSHHGPPSEKMSAAEAIGNWGQVLKSLQDSPIRLFVHGHARQANVVPLKSTLDERPADGSLEDYEMLRVMAPTTHLNGKRRNEGLAITLEKVNGQGPIPAADQSTKPNVRGRYSVSSGKTTIMSSAPIKMPMKSQHSRNISR